MDSGNFGKERKGTFSKALPLIDLYIQDDYYSEIAHYLRGRILESQEDIEEAISEMKTALSIKSTYRTLYRLGRIKEEKTRDYGVIELCRTVSLNTSSLCAHYWFKKSCDKKDIKLHAKNQNSLVNLFNKNSDMEYREVILSLYLIQEKDFNNIDSLKCRKLLEEFTMILKDNVSIIENEYFTGGTIDCFGSIEPEPWNYGDNESFYNDSLDMDQQSEDFYNHYE